MDCGKTLTDLRSRQAVMPTNGWAGLTASDDSQAKAIAAVMKKFTDEGIEVWLRFGALTLRSSSAGPEEIDAFSFRPTAHEVKCVSRALCALLKRASDLDTTAGIPPTVHIKAAWKTSKPPGRSWQKQSQTTTKSRCL